MFLSNSTDTKGDGNHLSLSFKALGLLLFGGSLLIMSGLCAGCQRYEGSERQLKEDADSFATYYFNWHFLQAAKYCIFETRVWLRYASSNVHQADIDLLEAKKEDATVEIEDVDFHDDEVSATVRFQVKNFYQMDTIGQAAHLVDQATFQLPMEMHKGRWQVKLTELPKKIKDK